MTRRWIWIVLVMLLIPMISTAWLTLTEDGLLWLYQQAKSYIPGQLNITRVQGRLIGPVILSGIEYEQSGLHIQSQRVEVNWHPERLIYSRAEISKLHIQGLDIDLPRTQSNEQVSKKTVVLPDVKLPIDLTISNIQLGSINILQAGQVTRLKQINASVKSSFNQVNIEQLDVLSGEHQLSLTGKITPSGKYLHDLNVEWQTRLASGDALQGKGRIAGNIEKTRIIQQLKKPSSLRLEVDAFKLLQQPAWQAKIDLQKFDSAQWKIEFPELTAALKATARGDLSTAEVSGQLDAQRDDTGPFKAAFNLQWLQQKVLKIDDLNLQLEKSDTSIKAQGQWKPGNAGGEVELDLDWKNLRWPIQQKAMFNSANGKGRLEGGMQSYRFNLETDKPLAELPASSWIVRGEGNQHEVIFEKIWVNTLEGEIEVKGKLNLSPQLSWQAEVGATNINPVSLYPEWPGKLNLALKNKGKLVDGQVDTEVDIDSLNGSLREYPVELQGQLSWQQHRLDIKNLNFHSGDSTLKADGKVDQDLQLNWSIQSSDLTQLYPAIKGELYASGKLNGSRENPLLKAKVKAKALSYLDYRAGAIEGEFKVEPTNLQRLDLNLKGTNVSFQQYTVASLNILGNAQKLQLKVDSEELDVDIELTGKAQQDGWKGQIRRANIDSKELQQWQLKKPAKLSFGRDRVQLQQLCWVNPATEQAKTSLCARLKRKGESWHSKLQLEQFSMLLFKPWLPRDLIIDGLIDVRADMKLEKDRVTGETTIDLSQGKIDYPVIDGERMQRIYNGGKIQLSLTRQGLISTADINLPDDEKLQADLSLPGANLLTLNLQQQPLKGQVNLVLHKLDFIDLLVPEVERLQGELAVNVALSGSVDLPLVKGKVDFKQGALSIPRMGLKIDKLTLKGSSTDFNEASYSLTAASGNGDIKVTGTALIDQQSDWSVDMNIKGQDFEVSHIPEASVSVSPDLSIKLKQHVIEINGKVIIPYAHIEPRDVSTATRVSSDVVIVGGQQQVKEKWGVISRVNLALGDRVHFFGYGLEGRLGGKMLLLDDPGLPTRASGEITIDEGRYRAYGQRLDIEKGRLLFSGGPLTKPGLDVRAVRKVNTVTAGIRVKGYVDEPTVELFSVPAMGQTEMLSYLILGRPVDSASNEEGATMAKAALALGLTGGDKLARNLRDKFGLDEMRVASSDDGDQASLVVGRYLSPKLYVSYGVGLIEDFNTVIVRYKISDQWQLKAESGEADGADIIYTIER